MRSNSRGLLQNRVILMVKSYPAAKLFCKCFTNRPEEESQLAYNQLIGFFVFVLIVTPERLEPPTF